MIVGEDLHQFPDHVPVCLDFPDTLGKRVETELRQRFLPDVIVEHEEHPAFLFGHTTGIRMIGLEKRNDKIDVTAGIDVEEAAESFGQGRFVGVRKIPDLSGFGAQPRPTDLPAIDVIWRKIIGFEEVSERQIPARIGAEGGDTADQGRSALVEGLPDVLQDVVSGDPFQLDHAAAWQMGEVVFDLLLGRLVRPPHQGAEPLLEVVVPVRLPDKIEDGQAFLPLVQAQPSAQLLEEDGEALRRPQEEDRVDLRDIDPLVVEIDDKNEANFVAS